MTGRQVLAAVCVVVLLTAVIPPGLAYAVNKRRVARATQEAARIANELSARPIVGVLQGPGSLPQSSSPDASVWLTEPRHPMSLEGTTPAADPWGNSYLANDTWVLSAGPNGTIETGFRAISGVGDDCVARRQ